METIIEKAAYAEHRITRVSTGSSPPDKAAEGVVTKLRPFRGTLTADAEHRFNAVYATGRVVEAGCNAHGRRKVRDAEATRPDLAAEGGAFIAAMYVAEYDAQIRGLVDDALRVHRRRTIRPIVAKFRRWLAAVAPTLLPSEPLAVAVRYYQLHGDALFRFVDDPDVPIDNSPTEREFQNVAKLRLNVLFAGSTEGCAPCLRPARHHRFLPCARRPRPGLSDLGLRAPRHPPRRLRAADRAAHARGVPARTPLSPTTRAEHYARRSTLRGPRAHGSALRSSRCR